MRPSDTHARAGQPARVHCAVGYGGERTSDINLNDVAQARHCGRGVCSGRGHYAEPATIGQTPAAEGGVGEERAGEVICCARSDAKASIEGISGTVRRALNAGYCP